jgi:hypothetical protein
MPRDGYQVLKAVRDPVTNAIRTISIGYMWRKYTLTYAQFALANTVNTIELFSLPAGHMIDAVKIKHSVKFLGGAISAYVIQVGITGTLGKYSTNFDVFQNVADAARKTTQVAVASLADESPSAATSIKVTATSTGANLNAATQGQVDIWVRTSDAS